MRVNIYAEEMTERVEIISKVIDGHTFTGLRLYLELPATVPYPKEGTGHTSGAWSMAMKNVSGPFIHREGDDDSSAVTFWGKRDLRKLVAVMKEKLDTHYGTAAQPAAATDEKGRPMTYWGGLAAPAAAGVSEEPAAWFYDHPDALHGDRHVRWQNARPTGLNALVWKPLYRHSLSERAGWRWLKDSTFDERSFHEDAPLENGIYHNDCVNCGRTFVGYKRRTICKVCSSLAARSKE